MAELLLRVADKVNAGDIYRDVQLTKRGDVIVAMDNGWSWSQEELTNPEWRIVVWPDVSLSYASVFLSQEIDARSVLVGKNNMLQRRGFSFDLDSNELTAEFKAWLLDDSRASPSYTLPAGIKLQDLRKKKTPRDDPSVIG